MRIKPFKALHPPPDLAPRVASPPYDVVSTEEARALADGNPLSFLHVVRPEIDLPPNTSPYADEVYARAVENFTRFQAKGRLVRDVEPAFYVYRQVMGDHEQYGLVTACHVEDYEANVIRKHELTRKDKEDDRTRHMGALDANPGPVFLTYRDQDQINRCIEAMARETPFIDFEAPDGVRHTVWRETRQPEELVKAFEQVPVAYIADGHHRSAGAVRVARERRAANPAHTGDEEYNWFLCALFPASQLNVLAYNRCVRDLGPLTPERFRDTLRQRFTLADPAPATPTSSGHISMYLEGRWYGLSADPGEGGDPISRLDVAILQDRLLAPVLGITDPRNDDRMAFVGGIRGAEELVRRVDEGRAAVAFSLYPTSVDQLMEVADAGGIMPPKSTWFEPKLRSGLLIHTLD